MGDELITNITAFNSILNQNGDKNRFPNILDMSEILAVITTTSAFAPRAPDDIVHVAEKCAEFEIPHVVNNAYGVHVGPCMASLALAMSKKKIKRITIIIIIIIIIPC